MQKLSLDELIDINEPGWSRVTDWLNKAVNQVEVLDVNDTARAEALVLTQVTTRSTLGAVIYESGGLLIDNGWLRILGSGNAKLTRSVPDWNLIIGNSLSEGSPAFLLVADDAVGGFYAVDGGRWGTPGHVHYHSPDQLVWEDTGSGYTDFLCWCLTGNLKQSYADFRWQNWEIETHKMQADLGVLIYPFLCAQGPALSERHRSQVPMIEPYKLFVDELPRQIFRQNPS